MKKTVIFFTIVLSLWSVVFAMDFAESEISIYNEVTSAFDTGFYPGAVEKANLLQKEYPDSVFVLPALVQKGEALINLKKYTEAQQTLEDAVSRMHTGSENFARSFFLLGKAYYFTADYSKALQAFHSSCTVSLSDKTDDFYNPSVLYSARIFYLLQEYENSLPLFEYVVSNGQKYSLNDYEEALQKILIAYNNSGSYQKALNLYNHLNEVVLDTEVYYTLCLTIAESYEKLDMNEQAYSLYCEIIESGITKLSVIALKKSYILAGQKQIGVNPAEIFAKTSSTFSENPDLVNEFWIRLGIDEYNQNNLEKAQEYFDNAGENGIVLLYKQKIAIDTKKDIAEVEKNLEQNEQEILSSGFENASDSYYSLLLICKTELKKWDEAFAIYDKLQKPDGNAVYAKSAGLYSLQKYDEAVAFTGKALSELSITVAANSKLWELYASALAKAGKVTDSMNVYRAIASENLLSAAGKLEYSKVLFTGGKYKSALEFAAASGSLEGEYLCGICSINLKDWSSAHSFLSSYIKKAPSYNKMALFYKAYAEYCMEQFKDACTDFAKFGSEAEVKDAKYVRSAYEFAAKAAMQCGDYKNAVINAENVLKNSVSEKDKHDAVLFCAEIYSDNGDWEKALKLLKPYSEQKGEFAVQALSEIAKIYVKQNQILQADKIYVKIYTENPDSQFAEEAMYKSGEIFYTAGDYSSAETKLNKYIYKYVNGRFIEPALFYCGDSYFRLGELEQSIMMGRTLVQKYAQSIYTYGTYKNLMNAYYETKKYSDALVAAQVLVNKFSEQAASDGIGTKLTELEKIAAGADPEIARLLSDYEKNGKASTKEGRKIGTELAIRYYANSDFKIEGYTLATELLNSIKDDSEKLYAAQNADIIADYNRSINENKKAAEMYLLAAEYYRSSSNDENLAAAALYGALDSFVAEGLMGDAKETANLLIKLYPESKQAKNAKRRIK